MLAHRRLERGVRARLPTSRAAQLPGHAQRVDLRAANAKALHRQRIEHFVREHHAAKFFGQAIEPFDARRKLRARVRCSSRALPLAQIGADFENEVTLRQRVPARRARSAHRPPSRPSPRRVRGSCRRLTCCSTSPHWFARQRLNSGEISGAVTKSPPRAELGRAGAVVAEAGLVQRHLHEALEADPAAVRVDLVADALDQPRAVRGFVRRQRRQRQRDAHERIAAAHRTRIASTVSSANMSSWTLPSTLAGRAVLVTGAARRIGAAIARGFHADGANVCIHFHRSAREAEQLRDELNRARAGSAAIVRRRPARSRRPCRLLVEAAVTRVRTAGRAGQQRLDVLSHAARQISPAQWDDLIGTNLRAPLFLSQAAAPQLRAHARA